MSKYLWYCPELGISDDFDTFKECKADAMAQCEEYGCELSIYYYDADKFPNGDVEMDDCKYLGYISLEK